MCGPPQENLLGGGTGPLGCGDYRQGPLSRPRFKWGEETLKGSRTLIRGVKGLIKDFHPWESLRV